MVRLNNYDRKTNQYAFFIEELYNTINKLTVTYTSTEFGQEVELVHGLIFSKSTMN